VNISFSDELLRKIDQWYEKSLGHVPSSFGMRPEVTLDESVSSFRLSEDMELRIETTALFKQ